MTVRTDEPVYATGSKLNKIAVVVAFGPFLAQLDTTVVNVALSTLSTELDAPLGVIQWVASGYLLALALMVPLTGWLVDRVGAKRVYVACFTLFTLASTLCGFATSANQLIAFRVLQGMAGGLMAPMSQMTMARHAGPNLARMMGIISMPIMTAPILGPSIAGLILHVGSWRWLFFMNLPVGLVAIALAIILLPPDDERKKRRLDTVGFLLVSPGLVLLLDGLKRLTTTTGEATTHLLEIGTALALLTAFVLRGLKLGASGLIDLRLFSQRTFSISATTQFLSNATQQSGQMLFPLFLLVALDLQPANAGLLLTAMGLGMLSGRPFITNILKRFGPRKVSVGGGLLCLAATLPFAWPGPTMPLTLIVAAMYVRGIGMGFVNMPSVVSAYSNIPRSSVSDAATAINIAQRLGGPIATMSIALLLQHLSNSGGIAGEGVDASQLVTIPAFHAGFALLCFINLLCLLSALRLPLRLN
jgi:EmrB/QacA subfamily drug resistance transporter